MGNQTISTTVAGPIFSNGGAITVTGSGKINGKPTGVEARFFSITTLSNSGSIGGGKGAPGGAGGIGVGANSGRTINLLTNANGATISGGDGGFGSSSPGGAGGAGVSNSGTIRTLTNRGTINGGHGGGGSFSDFSAGNGGAGVSNVARSSPNLRARPSLTRSNRRGTDPYAPVVWEGRRREASPYPDQSSPTSKCGERERSGEPWDDQEPVQ